MPFGVFLELAGDASGHVGAGAGHLLPGQIAIGKFRRLVRTAGIAAVSDSKEIERHGWPDRVTAPPPRPWRAVQSQTTGRSIPGGYGMRRGAADLVRPVQAVLFRPSCARWPSVPD
ncbi:hypothetical protein BJA5080_02848 [Bradyrhizobium diazoefficiens SEMIA 5080]|uniref:Uncharacterized protein n=1 Tax=Bradyrhizobium diazoefficiens SEMIA 5080 TaxID=754504 RepID=A0A837CAH5_9BRAD|nr:hypothetical protein BJA5080_02848 [Bradyrhizobium diazoefficiens SEMIA 5080]